MYAVLAEESLTRLFSNTESTVDAKNSPYLHAHNCISNSTILNNNCFIANSNHLVRLQGCEKLKQWAGALLSVICFEILRDFFVLSYTACLHHPYI